MLTSSRSSRLVVMVTAVTALGARVAEGRPPQAQTTVPDVDIVATPTAPLPPLEAPRPTYARDVSPELRAAVEEALRNPALRGARVSVYAARLSDGAPLITLNEDAQLNPASCVKLVTSATALRVMRPEFRFRTEYLVRGTLEGNTLKGDLIVRGVGDPTIGQERLYRVATELSARGIQNITGDIILDDSYFDQVWEAPGWEQETQFDRAYAAPAGALSLTSNTVAVWVRPGTHRGAPAQVQVEPPSDHFVVESQVMTVRFGRRLWVRTLPDGDKTRVVVQGVIGVHEPAERVVRRIFNPSSHFGSSLMAMLRMRGINVKGRVRPGVTPENARQLLLDASPALKDIVTNLNHHSSNFVAEMLLKAVGAHVYGAPGTTQKGLQVVQGFLEREVGIPPGSYIMGNGSGLNDVNRFTTAQLVRLLRKMAQDPTLAPEYVGSLGVAGASGTLSHRMGATLAERQLRAKTGTLIGVSALSGYLETPRRETVAFSIMINGLSGPASTGWEMQDRIGAALAGDTDYNVVLARRAARLGGSQSAQLDSPAAATQTVPGGGDP
ncbi:MAG: D-alanyl-D-alanine carboxypeptidase/D-alanyl-D-alanine-endopeptidase [Myxococcota bacterium]